MQFLLLQDSSPKRLNNASTNYTPQNDKLEGSERALFSEITQEFSWRN
jgi:hypothetical protein